ncbi:MAG: hypothetical protein OIN86_18450 [Candidatus Methanoperedens sp.]|nr:hypothetical protein [Candidatus Methanoperedens sp.]
MSSITLAEGLLPPFLGAATITVIFWLGSRLYNWKAGLLNGVFASVSLFLLQRTLKGSTFHHALSLFLIISTIALVVRALDVLQYPLPAKRRKRLFTYSGYYCLPFLLDLLAFHGAAILLFIQSSFSTVC